MTFETACETRRVSTYLHGTPEHVASQRLVLSDFCAARPEWLVQCEFTDGPGKFTNGRPGLARLKQAIRNRDCDVVVVTSGDRISRSLGELSAFLVWAAGFDVDVWTVDGSLYPAISALWTGLEVGR